MRPLFFLLLLPLLITSCGPRRYVVEKRQEPLVVVPKKIAPPRPIPPPQKKERKVIVLDAGHGGKDTGALSKKHGYEEKSLTLKTAKLVKGYLEELGHQVYMTRSEDTFIELTKRAEIANSMNAALFVSLHYNYSPSEEAHGVEIFYYKDEKNPSSYRLLESKRLGEEVLTTIAKHTGAHPRGVKRANYAVVRETKMPAILIEGGFLSNQKERDKIKEKEYMHYLAWGVARGINRYLEKKNPLATVEKKHEVALKKKSDIQLKKKNETRRPENRPRRELNARPAA